MKTFGFIVLICLFAAIPAHAQTLPLPPQLLKMLPDTRQRRVDDASVLSRFRKALLAEFEQRLDQPDAYVRQVKAGCARFPEGDLFPYLLPAFAYASLADRGLVDRPHAQQRIAQLIELARPAVIARLKPPGDDLMKLTNYREHATYLGQFMLALCAYRLAGGDERYNALRSHLVELIRNTPDPGGSHIFKGIYWTFDTIPVLTALHWHDHLTGTNISQPLIESHWKSLNKEGTDPTTHLPYSGRTMSAGFWRSPRGCDLSWRIALMAQFDPARAKAMYEHYTASFRLDQGFIAGFREYAARGKPGMADADSGPIIADVGGTATTLGIAATLAMDDQPRLHRLCQQLDALPEFLPLIVMPGDPPRIAGMIPFDKQYHTGFLYGDITLFYAVTWSDWRFSP
ncbi:MAG: hypothetical protein WC058_10890 [Phycisphaeraceae bacterium]